MPTLPSLFPLSPALTKSTSPSLFFALSPPTAVSLFPSSSIALRCVLRAQVFATRAQWAAAGGGCAGCCVGVAKSNQTAMSAWHVISKKEAKNQKEQPQNVTKRIENRSKESERSEKFKLPFGWWKTFAQVLAVFGFIFEWILVSVCVCVCV